MIDSVSDADVEHNSTLHVAAVWSGVLRPGAVNNVSIALDWSIPSHDAIVCFYGIHYYPQRKVDEPCELFNGSIWTWFHSETMFCDLSSHIVPVSCGRMHLIFAT